MTNTSKPKLGLHFSRKLLAIPYALFLLVFVVAPLIIVMYYAFTNDDGKFSLEYVRVFFNENGEGLKGFFSSYNFKTIMQSLFISRTFFISERCVLLYHFNSCIASRKCISPPPGGGEAGLPPAPGHNRFHAGGCSARHRYNAPHAETGCHRH